MAFELGALDVAIPAEVAFKGFVPAVDSHVDVEVPLLLELDPALKAGVRPVFNMLAFGKMST